MNNELLHQAAYHGDQTKVAELLDYGFDIESKSVNGWTPLYYAVLGRQIETVKFLIKRGANIEATTMEGFTILCWAAGNGYDDMVRLLLDHGANINAQTTQGWTSLTWAFRLQHYSTVKILLDSGAIYNNSVVFDYIKKLTLDLKALTPEETWIIWQPLINNYLNVNCLEQELDKTVDELDTAHETIEKLQQQIAQLTLQLQLAQTNVPKNEAMQNLSHYSQLTFISQLSQVMPALEQQTIADQQLPDKELPANSNIRYERNS